VALNVSLQVRTDVNATGNKTISLASNFDPKAVIVWATPQTADGSVATISYAQGFATYRGAAVQQRYMTIYGLDASANSDTARGNGTGALLKLFSAGVTPTVDVEIALVSMSTGGTSNVVYNVVNAHASAIRVFMLILGGTDITDALVDDLTMTTVAALQDETVVAGFGKPELMFMSPAFTPAADSGSDSHIGFGFGKQGEAGHCWCFTQDDANAASVTATTQRSDRIVRSTNNGGTDLCTGRLDTTVSNWPTDGFRLVYDANPTGADTIHYLAIRGTFQSATGANTAPTAGGLPVVQDNACGFAPKLGFLFGWNLAASTTIQTAAADQCGFGIGAYDGTTEAWCGATEDDAALTMVSKSQNSTAKVIQNYNVAAALQSEADGAFSGNNFRLSWNDIDTVAREYQWLALGDAPAAAEIIPDLVMARS
jgi:hypothetical protein